MSLARRFGSLDLGRSWDDGDRVFTTLPFVGIVSMGVDVAVVLATVALAALVVLIVFARRRGHASWIALGRGVLVMGGAIVSLVVAGTVSWAVLTEIFGADTIAFPDFDGSDAAMSALLAVAGSAFVLVMLRYMRKRRAMELALGALVWVGVLQISLLVAGPSAVALATWPLLGGIVSVAVWMMARPTVALPLLVVAAAPTLLVLLPQLYLWIDSPSEPVATMLVAAVLLSSLIPQIALIAGFTAPGSPDTAPAFSPEKPSASISAATTTDVLANDGEVLTGIAQGPRAREAGHASAHDDRAG
jgi:hypothetical protein